MSVAINSADADGHGEVFVGRHREFGRPAACAAEALGGKA